MKLKILHLFLITDRNIEETPTQLRGFIGTEFKKFSELHHHSNSKDGKKLIYGYPKIQYKINRNRAIILAIGEENISILRHMVLNLKDLRLGHNIYNIVEIKANYDEPEFKITDDNELKSYEFHSPWIALNVKNYQKFQASTIEDRRSLLKKILIGNILSMSKYLGYTVPSQIKADIEIFPIKTIFKKVDMIGFKGKFEINFLIPDYLGIGKGVSHGFGTVKHLSNEY